MAEQTAALNQMMDDIVRHSTIRHAAIGAAVGCGIAVLGAGGATDCLAAAAAGGVVGAVTGNRAGKRDMARRMELVSANDLVRSIRKSNDQLGTITTNLPKLLDQQVADAKSLQAQKAKGRITTEDYEAGLAVIKSNRGALAQTLMMTSQQARTASANLAAAAAQGQTGLDWHISAIDQLERETLSARSSISLL